MADRFRFDAIEFRDDFACIDVLYDLAFLLMDLDRHGLRAQANAVLNRYLERTGDYAGLAALPLFMSCRAAMRAHVTVTAARLQKSGAPAAGLAEAVRLLNRANDYLATSKPKLIAIGGLSGTGKSTLAAGLAPLVGGAPGAIVLRTDVTRKELCGVGDLARLSPQAYSGEVTRSVYAKVEERAGVALAGEFSVITDAVFGSAAERAQIGAVAKGQGADFLGIWLEAPSHMLERRVADRHGDASDATVSVLRSQLAKIRAPRYWTRCDAQGSPADVLARVLPYLVPKT